MDDFLVRIYVDQVKDQINNAESVYSGISNPSQDLNLLFKNIYYFILHVSNIVKVIQPDFKSELDFKKYRMNQIKKMYPKLPNLDPKLVFIRNDFEHFDERIDNWIINSIRHNYIDKNAGDSKMVSGGDPIDEFRFYNIETKTLYFSNKEYPLEILYKYVQDVKRELLK